MRLIRRFIVLCHAEKKTVAAAPSPGTRPSGRVPSGTGRPRGRPKKNVFTKTKQQERHVAGSFDVCLYLVVEN